MLFVRLLPDSGALDRHDTGAGSSSPAQPWFLASELHQCFQLLPRADPQLFFGITLILIAL